MRILVTGGAGFIGSHLTRRLLADGHEVHVLDNESNGLRSAVPAGAHFVHGDVIRPEDLEPAFAKKLDAVCHLAGQVSIIRAFDNPVGDLRTNTEGTVNVVQQCVKHRVPRLIYASSMTAYGDCERVPTPESEPCKPDSYYGITKFAAERYGVTGVGVTIAREQAAYARESCRDLPVAIRLQDYREMREKFDHVFSIGMFEHVGVRNYRRYMKVVRRCLHPGGRFLLHTIGGFRSTNHTDAWIGKYIFPNSMIPSRGQIERAIDGIFGILHWQSIGANYERTLLAWRSNLERSPGGRRNK